MIVQPYKARLLYSNLGQHGGIPIPLRLGASSLNWPSSIQMPPPASNYWQFNYSEGVQMPMLNLGVGLLDQNPNSCLLSAPLAKAWFLDRDGTYSNDSIPVENVTLFDGYSGFRFSHVKWDSFILSGSKSEPLQMAATALVYAPNGADSYEYVGPNELEPSFGLAGRPLNFQGVSIFKNLPYGFNGYTIAGNLPTKCVGGVVAFRVAYSNNHVPDMTMVDNGKDRNFDYICPLPVAMCAGLKSVAMELVIQSFDEGVISDNDSLHICIRQGGIATMVSLTSIVVENRRERTVSTGRQMRSYRIVGFANDTYGLPPLTITPIVG